MLAMLSHGTSHTGMLREINEDYFDADDRLQLFIVADGMGGHAGGHIASSLATKSVHDYVDRELAFCAHVEVSELLVRALINAHEDIREAANENLLLFGMATTIIVAMQRGGTLTMAHLGDCRAYRQRNGCLERLTSDHSYVAAQIKEGRLSEEEAREHPYRSVVTRGLGGYREEIGASDVEITESAISLGDRFLLCSDGLTTMLRDEKIHEIFQEGADASSLEVCKIMIAEANACGGNDNITTVLMSAEDVPEGTLMERRSPEVYRRLYEALFKERAACEHTTAQ